MERIRHCVHTLCNCAARRVPMYLNTLRIERRANDSCVRQVLQKYFRKFSPLFLSPVVGPVEMWESRAFLARLCQAVWESAFCADFHSGVISIRPLRSFF